MSSGLRADGTIARDGALGRVQPASRACPERSVPVRPEPSDRSRWKVIASTAPSAPGKVAARDEQ